MREAVDTRDMRSGRASRAFKKLGITRTEERVRAYCAG